MQISRLELSLLRLSDGIASKADLDRLSQHFDEEQLSAWRQVSSVVSRTIENHSLNPLTFQNRSCSHYNLWLVKMEMCSLR